MSDCACRVWAADADLIDDLLKDGRLQLLTRKSEDYVDKARVRCAACGTVWRWSRDDSFHSPEVVWREVKGS